MLKTLWRNIKGLYQLICRIDNGRIKLWTNLPRWLSTDLRDGNQSLPDPMTVEEKKEYFHKLIEIGYKEIEVSFPSASQTDYDFTRYAVQNAPGMCGFKFFRNVEKN